MRQIYVLIFLFAICSVSLATGVLFYIAQNKTVDFSALEQYSTGKPSVLLDCHGKEWGRFEYDKREPIELRDMPEYLWRAFLAAEDDKFFQHSGISPKAILRAICANVIRGRRAQGGSTITQQLVRLLYFDPRRTFTRKIKEQITALLVEQQFTKPQILEKYLNHIYLGCGIYGVEAAAQRFWGTGAAHVSIDQAAILASIINSPGRYCPLIAPGAVKARRDWVLGRMEHLRYITAEELQEALAKPVEIRELKQRIAPHAQEAIRLILEAEVGKERLYSGGLRIQTTIDFRIQRRAEAHFTREFNKLKERFSDEMDGALMSIAPQSGEIRALIGGYSFAQSKFNRALQARRQMGSVFKPLVYAAAVDRGKKFSDTAIDEPTDFGEGGMSWCPNNFNMKHEGEMTLAQGISRSNNILAVKTIIDAGPDNVVDLAKRCRIRSALNPYRSLALGCVDATLCEAVGAFNIFANDGIYVQPHLVKWVKDSWGTKIYRPTYERERVLSRRTAGQVAKALMISVRRYLNRHRIANFPAEAITKTGTTNDFRTAWFAGSTPELTTALYLGYDDNRAPGGNSYPASTIFPIWAALYKDIAHKSKTFKFDPSLKEITIDPITGEERPQGQPGAYSIYV